MKRLSNNSIKLIICLFIILANSCSLFKEKKAKLNFPTKEWKKDKLGINGDRLKIIKKTKLFELLKGYNSDEVVKILGVADFYCSDKFGFTYQYNYEYGRFKGQDKYNYKPKAKCELNKNLGSFISLEFDNNKKLMDVIFVIKD